MVGDSIVGDAREEYAEYVRGGGMVPGLWYWLHALRLAGGYVIQEGGVGDMGAMFKDLKYGVRSLTRMPGSAAISVAVLALGIGLCSFMFSLIYGLYFRGLGFPEEDRLLVIWETNVELNQTQRSLSIQDFADFRERQTSFEGLLGFYSGTVNVAGSEAPVRYQGAFVTSNTFDILGVHPVIGRSFAEGEDAPGAPLNVVLGWEAFRDDYGLDRSVIGRDVRVNGEPGTIIGVMPEGFKWPQNQEVWVPFRDDPLATARGQGRFATVYGRLKDGATREQAELDVASIARQLEQEYPDISEGIGARVETPVESNMNPQLNLIFGAMMVAVIGVLLVACANVANLLLARAAMRTREAGIRVALGGSRLRVMLPFFAEALVLSAVGAVLGIGIAYIGVEWFDTVTDPSRTGRPYFMQFMVDGPVLLFVIGVTVLTALAAGIAPAFQMSRTDVNTVLKDEGRGSSSLHMGRLTRVLVTAEVALSCALLVGAGLMTKSIVNIGQEEYAYPTDEMFTARVGLFNADYPDRDSRQRLWEDLRAELNALPQIASASLTTALPHGGAGTRRIAIEGVEYADPQDMPSPNRVVTSTGFFETLGIAPTGRDFVLQDDLDSDLVAIVNQPMVDRYFDGQSPIGRQFRQGASDTLPALTIIGVVPDLQVQGSLPPGFPGFEPAGYYVPLRQNDVSFMSIAAMPRAGAAMSITGDVRSAVRRLDADLPIYNVRTEAEVIDRGIWFFSVFGTVFIVFGLAALFMASVGLYGVLSFAVSRRTQEMGIRMALGAGSGDVVRLVARQGAAQLAVGLGVGLALAFGVTRLITILMFNVDPQDPLVFGLVFGAIIVVGMAAAVFPARRATSVDPVEALRYD